MFVDLISSGVERGYMTSWGHPGLTFGSNILCHVTEAQLIVRHRLLIKVSSGLIPRFHWHLKKKNIK